MEQLGRRKAKTVTGHGPFNTKLSINMDEQMVDNLYEVYQVDGFEEVFRQPTCEFCRIVKDNENQVYQDSLIYIFRDRKPAAEHHYQVVPKWHIENVNQINRHSKLHFALINQMFTRGLSLIAEWHPKEFRTKNFKMGFHKAKFTSVDHLHMHMIVGKKQVKTYLKYNRLTFVPIIKMVNELEGKRSLQEE